jgi:hypothetical protein
LFFKQVGEKLSEVQVSSDRFGGARRKAVRSKGQVQTGLMAKGEKLSEVRSSSDRFGGARRKAVRSKVKFGQVWWCKGKSCQK